MNLGVTELILILGIVVLLFGAKRLPQLGEGIGKAIQGLKRGLHSDEEIEIAPADKRLKAESGENVRQELADAEVVEKKT